MCREGRIDTYLCAHHLRRRGDLDAGFERHAGVRRHESKVYNLSNGKKLGYQVRATKKVIYRLDKAHGGACEAPHPVSTRWWLLMR